MKIALPLIAALFLQLNHTPAMAGASGLDFSDEEIALNRQKAGEISKNASACLDMYWNDHAKFFETHGYSKFYGNRNKRYASPDFRRFALLKIVYPNLVREGDEAAIKAQKAATAGTIADNEYVGINDFARFAATRDRTVAIELERIKADLIKREKELKDISCVDLTRRCLGSAFDAAGLGEAWDRIDEHVISHGVSGIEMQKALVDLGWVALYWNPDPSQNITWDEEDKALTPLATGRVWMPVWGGHNLRYLSAMRKNDYFGVPIADNKTLVGFQRQTPATFKKVPFFVGTAHAGYHVFPGSFGRVVEGHSMRALSSRDNLEFSQFNPLDQGNHGGPKWTNSEKYRSGVIVVPPGMMPSR